MSSSTSNFRAVFLKKYLPLFNFAIGTTALTFQMTVLYPWHHQLENDFTDLKQVQLKKLQEYHEAKLARLAMIEQNTAMILQKTVVDPDYNPIPFPPAIPPTLKSAPTLPATATNEIPSSSSVSSGGSH